MKDLRKLSQLPMDRRYWDDLEAEIVAELGPRVRARADRRPVLGAQLAARAWGLLGVAAAAGLAALLFVPARTVDTDATAGLLRLPDDDPTVYAFVSAPAPPPLASLVISRSRRGPDD